MDNTRFKVYVDEKSQDYGRFCIEPLERGYGDTLGNALRRMLLSSIRGAAVTAVKIEGVLHEFSTVKGVREDIIELMMNLKHIPIRAKTDKSDLNEEGFKIITLDSDELPEDFFTRDENPGVITAHDMPWDNDFEFCGDGVLCSLEPTAHLMMEIYVEQGVGYLSAERERPSQPSLPINALLADAIFSPVRRVNYKIEPARVGQSIDFDRLILEVWTNGAVTPEEALSEAAGIARDYFGQIAETANTAPQKPRALEMPDAPMDVDAKKKRKKLDDDTEQFTHSIHELELSIRSENCLLRGGIQTIGDLLQRSRDDLLKIRNLGRKSLTEIEEKIAACGYSLNPNSAPVVEEPTPEPEVEPEAPTEEQPEAEPEVEPEAPQEEPKEEQQPEAEAEAPKEEPAKPTKPKRSAKKSKEM